MKLFFALLLILGCYSFFDPTCPTPSGSYLNLFFAFDTKQGGQPVDRACSFCPKEPVIPHSLNYPDQHQTFVLFKNAVEESVYMYFVTIEGQEIAKGPLLPGQRARIRTFEGHLFRFYNEDKSILYLEHLIGLVPLYNDFRVYSAMPHATSTEIDADEINRGGEPDWNSVYPTGFINRANYNLDLYWNGDKGLELAAQIKPNQIHREFTYYKHVWRAQIHKESLVLTDVEIVEVSIAPCPERKKACGIADNLIKPMINTNVTEVSSQCDFFGAEECKKIRNVLELDYMQELISF